MPKVDQTQGIAAIKYMNLPVLGPPDLLNPIAKRMFYDSQFDFNAYVGSHPCFSDPDKYTTVFFTGGHPVDIAVPFGQFTQTMLDAGAALAAQVDEHKGKQIVLATSIPKKGTGL